MSQVRRWTSILILLGLALNFSCGKTSAGPLQDEVAWQAPGSQSRLIHETGEKRGWLPRLFHRLRERGRFSRRLWRWRRGPYQFHKLLKGTAPVRPGCLTPTKIHKKLRSMGWWDFRRLSLAGEAFRLEARHPSGSIYYLKVDLCTGKVIGARRLPKGPRPRRLYPR